jgi:hypothetical protein
MPKENKGPKNIKLLENSSPAGFAGGTKDLGIFSVFHYLDKHISYLNSSKYFAGIMMILLNIGARLVPVQFSNSAEVYFKMSVTQQLVIFSMAWIGTRDIYTSLIITAIFAVLSQHLFNEESHLCVVPEKYRTATKFANIKKDENVSPEDIKAAEQILAKAKAIELQKQKDDALSKFSYESIF